MVAPHGCSAGRRPAAGLCERLQGRLAGRLRERRAMPASLHVMDNGG